MINPPVRRNSLRYPGYDYRQAGGIFVTICTHNRQRLFGSVVNGAVVHTPAGVTAERFWRSIPNRFPGVLVDSSVVMPDHLHGILLIGTDPEIETTVSVGDVVRWFKASMHSAYRKQVATGAWLPFQSRLWQRDYHERIIRNDRELDNIRDYIDDNPARWQARTDT